mgnify:CR=1 FL=1
MNSVYNKLSNIEEKINLKPLKRANQTLVSISKRIIRISRKQIKTDSYKKFHLNMLSENVNTMKKSNLPKNRFSVISSLMMRITDLIKDAGYAIKFNFFPPSTNLRWEIARKYPNKSYNEAMPKYNEKYEEMDLSKLLSLYKNQL